MKDKIYELLDSLQHESIILGVIMAVGMGLDWLSENMEYSGGAHSVTYMGQIELYRVGRVILMREFLHNRRRWSYFYTYQHVELGYRKKYYDLGE